ncbi:Rpn family recombination-promoting nuclease/putative transposase [Limibacterium fermenti]|uniref:Rpn family recombination-promoting nuclease/putative transposase n=1 Tax=Limibacterium fermenti TaxID=3229863 RepID=UPI003A72A524
MERFINPFSDMGFKRIFGQEATKDLLIDFLNDLLEGEKTVTDITFLDKEILPDFNEFRGAIYDIYCVNESGEHFIVEMQNGYQTYFRERALFYLSHIITRQGRPGGDWHFDVKAVYGVFFMNFCLDDIPHKLRTDVILADRETHEQFSDKLRFIFIELPYFHKREDECNTNFDKWIYTLKNMETLKTIPFKDRKKVFKKLEKTVDLASMTPEERDRYEESIKVYRDYVNTIEDTSHRSWRKGRMEGRAEGHREGRVEGKIEMARNMKAEGLPLTLISKVSGLSAEEIEKLS